MIANRTSILCSVFLIVFSFSQAQKNNTVNNIIKNLIYQGDVSLRDGEFLEAEKHYLLACNYTDTIVWSHTEKNNRDYNYSPKKIYKSLDSYDKLGNLYSQAGNRRRSSELFKKSIKQRELIYPKKSVHRKLSL